MAIQDRERLRQLVGDYYHGLITVESYRSQRAALLDNIGAEVEELSDTVTARRKPAATREPPKGKAESAGPAAPSSSTGSKKVVFIAVAAVAVVAVVYLLATQMTGTDHEPTAEAEQALPQSGLERGDALIEEFLSRNNWTADSLGNFSLAWAALHDDQRQLATDGRRYRRLSTRLHQRIREEVALGTAPTSARMQSLVEFAATMGVPYTGSLASTIDDAPPPETVVEVDEHEAAAIPEAEDDDGIVAVSEDPEPGPFEPEPAEREPVEAAASPPAVVEQSADEDTVLVEAVAPEPMQTAPPEQAQADSPEPAAAGDDPCPASIANTRRPYCRDALPNDSKGPALVVLPTGSFDMGSDRSDAESPVHRVSIGRTIAMSRFEITADEYAEFCAATSLPCPANPWSENHPVVSVSWDDAVQYTEWLSETTGFRYRLPSEAEWEYAARAGTETPYYFGDEITPSAALSSVNGPVEAPVPRSDRSINRNPFRLYHMSGNIREWTRDAWYPNHEGAAGDGSARGSDAESARVVRGGSYSDPGDRLRSAAREPLDRSHRDTETGFRVVREVVATSR